MSYLIFLKNCDNIENTLHKIAENESDLNNLNIIKSDYKIIEISQDNFNEVKFGLKRPIKYNNDNITFIDITPIYNDKIVLKTEIEMQVNSIRSFLENNLNNSLYTRWNNYSNQLKSLNLDTVSYPLKKSLEKYFNDLGQPSFNILQLP